MKKVIISLFALMAAMTAFAQENAVIAAISAKSEIITFFIVCKV